MSTVEVSSEESRKIYAERKGQVLSLLESAKQCYENLDNDECAGVFLKLYNDLEKGEFSIVVVGEFSAGKSTLLNALMKKKVLPSFSNETTATVNFLRHSDKSTDGEAGRVFYNDGVQKVIMDANLDTVMEYVSTKGDDVAKRVEHLDLYLDSDFLKDGVTLVDSPGLNGVADGHREITEAQILKSHASIFLFNSDHPGSKTDFEFLHDLQSKVKTIIFVLNKIDEIKADENETPETVIETLKKTYKEKFPDETSVPEIWPVAAYPALVARNDEPLEYHDKVNRTVEEKTLLEKVSRLEAFENRLLSFLTCGEKAKQQLLSPVEKVISIAVDSRDKFEEEQRILENTVDTTEIENKRHELKVTIEGLEAKKVETKRDVASKVNEILRDIMEEVAAEMSRLQNKKLSEIDDIDDYDELISYLDIFEKSYISKVCRIALNEEDNLREEIISLIKLQYAVESAEIEQKLLSETFDINLSVSGSINDGDRIFKVGLDEMDEKVKKLESQLAVLNAEANEAEEKFYHDKGLERKQAQILNDIKYLQDKKELLESQSLPLIDRYTKEVSHKESRGGLFGLLGNVLFGKKTVTRHEQVEDRTLYDVAVEERSDRIAEVDREMEEQRQLMKEFEHVDSALSELKHVRKMTEVENVMKKLEAAMTENTRKIESKYKREVKKIRNELSDRCDVISDELNKQVKKVLRDESNTYIEIVQDTVDANLRKELNEKTEYLMHLEKQIESSQEEKNSRIEQLKDKIENLNFLLGMAADLQMNLTNITVDEIRQEVL